MAIRAHVRKKNVFLQCSVPHWTSIACCWSTWMPVNTSLGQQKKVEEAKVGLPDFMKEIRCCVLHLRFGHRELYIKLHWWKGLVGERILTPSLCWVWRFCQSVSRAAQGKAVLPKGLKPKTFWHSGQRAVTKGGRGPGISLSYYEHNPRLLWVENIT